MVTPAHRIGAISAKFTPAGSRAANGAAAMTYSAKPPFAAVAGLVLVLAHRFPAGLAIFATHAGIMQPRDPDSVPQFEIGHVRAEASDDADDLVARRERQRGFCRPVAFGRMQVGVAHAAGHHLDQNLSLVRNGNGYVLYDQRFDRTGAPLPPSSSRSSLELRGHSGHATGTGRYCVDLNQPGAGVPDEFGPLRSAARDRLGPRRRALSRWRRPPAFGLERCCRGF